MINILAKRPTLDEILLHPFINPQSKILRNVSISNTIENLSISCFGSSSLWSLNLFYSQNNSLRSSNPNKFCETAALGPGISKYIQENKPLSYEQRITTPKSATMERKFLGLFDIFPIFYVIKALRILGIQVNKVGDMRIITSKAQEILII